MAEGRFVCSEKQFAELVANGQIASQYVDLSGKPSMAVEYNPNGSSYAVEGITSPDGRVFGKMAHFERFSEGVYRNIEGHKYQPVFKGAVSTISKKRSVPADRKRTAAGAVGFPRTGETHGSFFMIDLIWHRAAREAGCTGSRTEKQEPSPGALRTEMEPPCRSVIRFASASPRPVPLVLCEASPW